MALPSEDHCGASSPRLSAGGENVSCRAFSPPPVVGTIQMWVLAPSAVESVTEKSTSFPSGESCGPPMPFRWRRSSLVGKWGSSAASADGTEANAKASKPAKRRNRAKRMGSEYTGENDPQLRVSATQG